MIIVTSCKTSSQLSKSGKKETEFVKSFIKLMMSNDQDEKELMNYISPSYIKENNLDVSKYEVNIYSPKGFSIESYDKDIVTAKIWGKDRGWTHQLKFKLTKEKGKLYLMPSKHSETYIHPWFEVNAYINKE